MLLLPPTGAALELRAAPLSESLPVIGRALGVVMRAAPTIGEEIVIARLDGATLEATKAHLAGAFAGEWRTEADGTLLFDPSPTRRATDRRVWFAARRTRVANGLARLRRELDAFAEFDAKVATSLKRRADAEAEGEEVPSSPLCTPIRRLLLRVLAQLHSDDFEAREPFARTVLSLTPTALQRPLPATLRDDLRRYFEEETLWRIVSSSIDGETGEASCGADRPPTRLRLEVTSDDRATRAVLTLSDPEGNDIETTSEWLDFDRSPDPQSRPGTGKEPLPNLPLGAPPAPLAFLEHEPLGYGASDAILGLARREAASVVAAPGDELLAFDGPWRDAAHADSVATAHLGTIVRDGAGWITIASRSPFLDRATFFPRKPLRRAARLIMRAQPPALADLLEATRLRPDWAARVPAEDVIEWSRPPNGLFSSLAELRLAAALTADEWRAASLRPMLLSNFNPRVRRLAHEALFILDSSEHRVVSAEPEWNQEVTENSLGRDPMLRLIGREDTLVEIGMPSERRLAPSHVLLQLDRLARRGPEERQIAAFDLDHLRFFGQIRWALAIAPERAARLVFDMEDAPFPIDPGTYTRQTIPTILRHRIGWEER